jgi:hypothetical protein
LDTDEGDEEGTMNRQRTTSKRLLLGITMAVTTLAVVGTPPAAVATEVPDQVIAWNVNATQALIVNANLGTGALVHLAIVHGAIYDAVNSIDGRFEPYLGSLAAERWYSKNAAAASAAYHVLSGLVPTQQATLDGWYATSLSAIPDGPAKDGGVEVGRLAADQMLEAREDDGRFGPFRFPVGDDPGEWRPVLPLFVNDPNAWVKDVRPFMILSNSQFRSDGPLAMSSDEYAAEFEQVKTLGRATGSTRTPDQTDQALFWADNAFAMWSRIFRQLAASNGLSVADNARLFAMLYLTAADAQITVWGDKAFYHFWRPITAIREAEFDGNPATIDEDGWLPLVATPPYPEHPSGHAAVSGSFVKTLESFFGTDTMSFSAFSNVSLTTRTFTRFSQAIKEIINARIYAGIHFRTADVQSYVIAKKVARWREERFFQPVPA